MNNIGGWKGEEPESVQCLARAEEAGLDEEDVFVPFSFVKKYFDVSDFPYQSSPTCFTVSPCLFLPFRSTAR